MGNPIYSESTGETQFERIKLARREHHTDSSLNSLRASFRPYETYASVAAASIRTTRRPVSISTHQQEGTIRSEDAMLFGGDTNEHPIRALLARQENLVEGNGSTSATAPNPATARNQIDGLWSSTIPSSNRLYMALDSADDLEEIIMRQLRPRTFSLLFQHAPTESLSPLSLSENVARASRGEEELNGFGNTGSGGNDLIINPADYQTMEMVMGRLRRQFRNSTARLAQETNLLHRSSEPMRNSNLSSIAPTTQNSTRAQSNSATPATSSGPAAPRATRDEGATTRAARDEGATTRATRDEGATTRATRDEGATTRATSLFRAAGYNPRDQLERIRRSRQERYQSIIPQNDFHDAFFRWTSRHPIPVHEVSEEEGALEVEQNEFLGIYERNRPGLSARRRSIGDRAEALDRRLASLIRSTTRPSAEINNEDVD